MIKMMVISILLGLVYVWIVYWGATYLPSNWILEWWAFPFSLTVLVGGWLILMIPVFFDD